MLQHARGGSAEIEIDFCGQEKIVISVLPLDKYRLMQMIHNDDVGSLTQLSFIAFYTQTRSQRRIVKQQIHRYRCFTVVSWFFCQELVAPQTRTDNRPSTI